MNFTLHTGEQVTIRNVAIEDAEAIIGYMKQVLTENQNLTMEPDEFTLTKEQEEAHLEKVLKSSSDTMMIALIDGTVVSTAGFHGTERRRLTHRVSLGISVLKDHHRKGIGKLMMEALIQEAITRGKAIIELEVRVDNLGAIALYEKLGFVKEGIKRHTFYVDNRYVDTMMMALYLEDRR